MARPVAIFFILLLAAVHILALPGGPEAPKKETAKQPPTNYNATWECNFKYKVLWDDYKLTGRDWGVNETVLLKQVNKAGIASKWRYKKWEKDGHEGFVSTVSMMGGGCFLARMCGSWKDWSDMMCAAVSLASGFFVACHRLLQPTASHQPVNER